MIVSRPAAGLLRRRWLSLPVSAFVVVCAAGCSHRSTVGTSTAESSGRTLLRYPNGITSPMCAPATAVRWAIPPSVSGVVRVRVPQLPGWSQDTSAVTAQMPIALRTGASANAMASFQVRVLANADGTGNADASSGPGEHLTSQTDSTVCGFPATTVKYVADDGSSVRTVITVAVSFGESRSWVIAEAIMGGGNETSRVLKDAGEMMTGLQILPPDGI